MGKLQGNLDKGIWAGFALLDQPFTKLLKRDNDHVHIISQGLSHRQGVGDHGLALETFTKKRECVNHRGKMVCTVDK